MHKTSFTLLLFILFNVSLLASNSLSYSGRLVQASGAPVNGPVNLRAELVYTNATSTILCSQNLTSVALTKGVFHLKLDLNCAPKTLSQVLSETPNGESVAMRIIDQTNSKSYPLQAIHSVPFSKVAEQLPQMGASAGQALAWDGSKWAPTSVGTGNGTVMTVNTGTGLTGGPVTTTGTISIANSGVGTTQIADGAVSNIKISDVAASKITGTLSGSQIGAGVLDQSHLSATANIPYSKLSINDGDIPAIKIGGLQSAIDSIIASVITNGDTTHAPSGDAVYDALQVKFDKAGGALTTGGTITGLPALPMAGSEATSKDYVDNQIASITSGSAANQWESSAGNVYRTSGKIGIGTNAPETILHLDSSGTGFNKHYIRNRVSSTGNTWEDLPGISLVKNRSNDPAINVPTINDEFLGEIAYGGVNSLGDAFHSASLSVTQVGAAAATGPNGGKLRFGTANGDGSGLTTRMVVDNTGNVGVGVLVPSEKLHVAGNINADGKLRLKSDNTNYVELSAPTGLAANLNYIFPGTAGTNGQVLTTNGSGVLSWSTVATTATTVGGDISGTIANAEIAAGAVGSTEIADASIVTADLADSSVTSAKIVDGTITDSDIANNTITYGKLNLANGSVPLLKLEGTRDGTKYLKGDNTWSTFATDVINSVLAGFTVASGTKPTVANGDTIVGAFGKIQKTLNDIDADYISKSGNNTVTGSFNLTGITSFLQIPTPSGAVVNEAANVQYVKNYVESFGQWTKNVNDIYYNTGKVGIGTSSPIGNFHIAVPYAKTDTTLREAFTISSNDAGNPFKLYAGLKGGATLADRSFTLQTGDHAIANGGNLLLQPNGGNVGVGTAVPQSKLDVYATGLTGTTLPVVNISANSFDNLGSDPTLLSLSTPTGGNPRGNILRAANSKSSFVISNYPSANGSTAFTTIATGAYNKFVPGYTGETAMQAIGIDSSNWFDGATPVVGSAVNVNITAWGGSTPSYRRVYGVPVKISAANPSASSTAFYADVTGALDNWAFYAANGNSYLSGNLSLGSINQMAKFSVTQGLIQGNSVTYLNSLNLGFSNDIGAGGAAQYLLLFPYYNGGNSSPAGFSGVVRCLRGNTAAGNYAYEYDISGQTAYTLTTASITPRNVATPAANLYKVTYSGTPYLALRLSEFSGSGCMMSMEGQYWNVVNSQNPVLVTEASATLDSVVYDYSFIGKGVYHKGGNIGVGTTNPTVTLDVNGSISSQGPAGEATNVSFSAPTGSLTQVTGFTIDSSVTVGGGFNAAAGNFQPTVPGRYLIVATTYSATSSGWGLSICKNASCSRATGSVAQPGNGHIAQATRVIYLNGTTDVMNVKIANFTGGTVSGSETNVTWTKLP